MANEHTAAVVISSLLFAGFFILWILVIYFCKCRDSKESDKITEELPNRKAYSPEPEEREAMIRRSLREKKKNEADSMV